MDSAAKASPAKSPASGKHAGANKSAAKAREKLSAEELSGLQRDISISEFFTKNRHLLGFDNASRALLTSVKEAVDNSLDACEEAGVLPDIRVLIEPVSESRYRMTVEDNGPGIVKSQLPKVFGKLLYGSKFHRLRQSRGQQGIGISAAGMYGQLTTGKPVEVTSKTGKGRPAYHCALSIDTKANKPVISRDEKRSWPEKDHGTAVSIEMEASYKGGKRSVDEWIQEVALANPHVRLEYWPPGKKPVVYPRVTETLPPQTQEIKPHPYGVELGMLMRMVSLSTARSVSAFLQAEFSRVSSAVAQEICATAGLKPTTSLKKLAPTDIENLYTAIGQTKIKAPPTNCLAPIGEQAMLQGLKALLVQQHFAAEEAKRRKKAAQQEAQWDTEAAQQAEARVTEALEQATDLEAEDEEEMVTAERDGDGEPLVNSGVTELFGHPVFLTAVTRSPKVYRGNPFQVEAAVAYGGELPGDQLATVYRLANRVPLLYQQGACAMTQAVVRTNWRAYDVEQAKGALPTGPMLVLVHIASAWVPFTSEAKEAVAHYDEVIGELKSALQECGRRLSRHIRRKRRIAEAQKKQRYIERYIPHIGEALQQILDLSDSRRDTTVEHLTGILERSRKL